MGKPAEKKPIEHAWQEIEPKVDDSTYSPVRWLKSIFFRYFGPRKHPRGEVDFSHPLRVRVTIGKKTHEVVAEDIGRGGMGLKCPLALTEHFESGSVMNFDIAMDGDRFESVQGEIRFVRKTTLNAYIGVKFTNVPSTLLQAIDAEVKNSRRD